MTERVTPNGPIISATNESAEAVREQIMSLLTAIAGAGGTVAGVVGANDLHVAQHAGTPAMNVDVAAGRAFVQGQQTNFQGCYHVSNDATKTLTIAASNPSNPRIDLVVATVRDGGYPVYAGTNDWVLQVITGTPNASPVAPSQPVDSLVLAQVAVAANATSIVNANITDLRPHSGGSTGQTLAFKNLPAPSFSTSSGSFVVMDSTAFLTVVAPASGNVLLTASALFNNNVAGVRALLGWSSGSVNNTNMVSDVVYSGNLDNSEFMVLETIAPGLTPGSTYQLFPQWAYYASPGTITINTGALKLRAIAL